MMPLSDLFAAVRWWAVLLLLGTAVTPLALQLFRRLPDRGIAFVKMLGLLGVSYLFWFLGSLGFLQNNLGGILVALLLLLGLSGWVLWQNKEEQIAWLRTNWRQVLLTELVFTLIFALWVWVRAQNPTIAGTEKPMEFAFLNAASRSPSFPPLDPWLSGFAISYYYFGYVMTSVLARLAAVSEPVAFNLGIAWLVAGSAVGAFGLVYNLIATYGTAVRRWALALGLVAAIALPIAGNFQVVLELMHSNNVGSAEFWQWLNVRDISGPANDSESLRFWWWWRSSRVINEHTITGAQTDPEPIAEFPGFSFILGDMHPHVLALPFAFLSLAVALLWWLEGQALEIGDWRLEISDTQSLISNPSAALRTSLQSLVPNWPLWLLTVLVLGGLSFLNTWDVLIHLFVVLGAFTLSQWRRRGWHGRLLTQTILLAVMLAFPAILLYLPFYIGFRSQAGAPYLLPMLMRPTRLVHFLIIFGLPLLSITSLLLALLVRRRFRQWQKGAATAVALLAGLLFLTLLLGWVVASSADAFQRVANLANELGLALPPRPEGQVAFGWGLTAVLAITPALIRAKLQVPGVTLLLLAIIAAVVTLWHNLFTPAPNATEDESSTATNLSPHHLITPSPHTLPFVLLLIGTGALLTLGPEFVYLKDNFGVRINTIFKFYYQAWVMFGVAALFGLFYLWRRFERRRWLALLVTAVYAALFLPTLLFPYHGIRTRAAEFRGPVTAAERRQPTLNGLADVAQFNSDEYEALMWLRQNAQGMPVIVEAVGGQYTEYGRVSASTGLPTLLGWAGHEYQWRGNSTDEPSRRDPIVRDIYTASTWDSSNVATLLDQYNVSYIYVGSLERDTYGVNGFLPGEEKFEERLEIAFQNGSVTIYRWQALPDMALP